MISRSKITVLFISFLILFLQGNAQTFSVDSYKKAVWMTARMYGGQRSGEGPNWLIMDHTVSSADQATLTSSKGFDVSKYQPYKCFTADADGTYSLSGGWVDCGDHVKFGQTMFYSGYMLALAYSEFPEGYDDYYSWDYSGYKAAGDYTWEGKKGIPNGIPDILDELKYQTDFFIKCARNATTFYSQIGMGDPDHLNWVSSVAMAALPKTQGGQADGARDFRKNPNDCVMPAMCAATLAVMSRLYAKFDPAYAALCLQHAGYAYEYAKSKKGLTEGATGGSFYPAKSNWEDSYAIMLAEMYRATQTASYKTEALTYAALLHNHNWTLCYNNCDDLAAYLLASFGDATAKALLQTLVNGYITDANTDKVFMRGPSWGVLRYTASQAFAAALLSKLNNETAINPYSLATIEFIMGKNSKNLSFIVGFGSNYAKRPHHRNYYACDDIMADKNATPVPTKNQQFGFLVGGAKDPASYNDKTDDYQSTEGGIDYNAGLVAALGYLNSKIAPIDVNKFGHPTPKLGDDKSICGVASLLLNSQVPTDTKKTFTWKKDGVVVVNASTTATTYTATAAGTYICLVDSAGKWSTSDEVIITATIPTVNLGADVTLCNPVSAVLDAGVTGAGLTYSWKKNSVVISGATSSTYTAYSAGTYSVTISASGCTSQTDQVIVTSQLPTVQHDTICSAGAVSLAVLATGGPFQWYSAPTGGTLYTTGTTYAPTISSSTTYYIQDASSVSITTGPGTSTFTGGVNWGNIGAKFTAHATCTINAVTFKPYAIYNSDPVSITVKLTKDGVVVGTYTSNAVTNAGVTNYTLTFPTPIPISGAGNYILEPTAGITPTFYESGPAYSTYSTYPSIIEFTGATNGTQSNNPFPAFYNWQISAGSTCARTPVFAVIDPNGNCGDIQAPSIPGTIVFSSTTNSGMTATWTASTDNVGVTGYEVYVNGVINSTVLTNSITLTGLTCNTSYTIKVRAKDAAGNYSAFNTESDNTTTRTSAPTIVSPVNYSVGATATALTATGTNLLWYTASTGGTGSSTAPVPSTLVAGTTNYYVSQTVNSCESSREMISVVVANASQTITLSQGWNLVSFYIVPADKSIATVFSSIMSKVVVIKDADNFYYPNQPAIFNRLLEIENGKAYLINVNSACSLSISGSIAPAVTIQLKTGWNMLGYPKQTNQNISTVLSGIWNNTFMIIKNFDGFKDKTSGTLNTMIPGDGYFIKVSGNSTVVY